LLVVEDAAQLEHLMLLLDANKIRHAIGLHRPWKAVATESWLMVPSKDLSRAAALSNSLPTIVTPFRVRGVYCRHLVRASSRVV
jgi:hypothetical protein